MAASHGQAFSSSHKLCGCKSTEPSTSDFNSTGERRLLTEIKAPVSAHELKSIHQLSPAERLRCGRGGAGEGEQAQGQVEEMREGPDAHLYLPRKQKQGQGSSWVLVRRVRVGGGRLCSRVSKSDTDRNHLAPKCNRVCERQLGVTGCAQACVKPL